MLIARLARVTSPEPEDKDKIELGRKLAVVTGLADPGLSEIGAFKIRMAAIEKPKAHVTIYSNDNEDRIEIGKKLALVAGVL